MKNKQNIMDADTAYEYAIHENVRLRRNQEKQQKERRPQNHLPNQNAAGQNKKDDEHEIEGLYWEMQGLQWGE